MANEQCVMTLKTLPAVADKTVTAILSCKNAFLAAGKELVLLSAKSASGVTDSAGEVALTLIRDAKMIDRDVGGTVPWEHAVKSDDLNVETNIVVPDSATANFADTIQ